MILTENHRIKRNKHKELFRKIDAYCYSAKNLSNSVQYLICQCYRIHQKLKNEELLESWEQEMIDGINKAIATYNTGRDEKKALKLVDKDNGYIADAYFLSWHMKRGVRICSQDRLSSASTISMIICIPVSR